jgi:glutathione synthase/RimK-type ligase-like ATP-grasp enzyme
MKNILIFCCINDQHADKVSEEIESFGYNSIQLKRELYNIEWTISNTIIGDKIEPVITYKNNNIHLENIISIYLRKDFTIETQDINSNELSEEELNYISIQRAIHVNSTIKYITSLKPTINKPESNHKCLSKIYQLHNANSLGLKIPNSFFGGNGEVFKSFYSKIESKNLCIKPLEGVHMKKDGKTYAHYTELINTFTDEEIASLSFCPTIIQGYIRKEYELRVTIVGEEIFACKIDSQKSKKGNIDWRHHDFENTPHFKIILPEDISIKLVKLMKKLDLIYGAIDLIFDGNDYYFLEVNTMGQWLWVEDLTEMKISNAIAKWLIYGN